MQDNVHVGLLGAVAYVTSNIASNDRSRRPWSQLQASAIAFGGPDGIGPPSRPPRCGHQWHRTFPSTKPEFRASGLGHDMLTCMTLKVLEAPLRHPFGKQSSTVIFCLRVDSQRISSRSGEGHRLSPISRSLHNLIISGSCRGSVVGNV